MKNLASVIAACASSFCLAGLGAGDELFRTENIDGPMTVEISEYRFSLAVNPTRSGEEFPEAYVINGSGPDGSTIEYELPHAEFQSSERLFAMSSYVCDNRTIDLVIQIAPPKYAETMVRRYYRVAFSPDLGSVIAQFYDPSVSAVNAVLPMQSVEEIPNLSTGEKIACDGSTPWVTRSN